jgi:hypothetical protein
MKSNLFLVSFGVRYSLFDLPAMPAKQLAIDPPRLLLLHFRLTVRYLAGQAGILRFSFELLPV